MKSNLIIIIIFLNLSLVNADFKGQVIDQKTKKPIKNATIYLKGTLIKRTTNSKGFFQLPYIGIGTYTITIEAPHYLNFIKTITISKPEDLNRIWIFELTNIKFSQRVEAETSQKYEPEISKTEIKGKEVYHTAGSLEDVTRVVKTLPGVSLESDFSSIMYVRGGDFFENMVFIDDAFIYNPYHLGGIATFFNTDLIEKVQFYSGGFPASYPNVLSSILDVKYRDGREDKLYYQTDISPLSAKFRIEGPFLFHNSNFILASRRTYFDLILNALNKKNALAVPYYSDIVLKLNFLLAPSHHLSLTNIYSIDYLKMKSVEGTLQESGSLFYKSTRFMSILNYKYLFSENYAIHTNFALVGEKTESELTGSEPFAFNTKIKMPEGSFKLIRAGEKYDFELGYQFTSPYVYLDSLIADFRYQIPEANRTGKQDLKRIKVDIDQTYKYQGLFFQNTIKNLLPKLNLNLGLRFERFSTTSENTFSPRFQMKYILDDTTSLNFSYGLYKQFSLNILYFDKNFGNPNLKAEQAQHFILGIEKTFHKNRYMFRLESYYKDLSKLIVMYDNIEDATKAILEHKAFQNKGKGSDYGFDLYIQKKEVGKIWGWLSYSYLVAKRFNPLNKQNPKWYFPRQDQRHNLSIVVNFKPNKKWFFSSTFSFHSGRPITDVIDWEAKIDEQTNEPTWIAKFGPVNGIRLPTYHKLDFLIERNFYLKRTNITTYIDIMNLYNHKNVYTYLYDKGKPPFVKPKKITVYNLPIIPFFGVRIDW